MSRDEAEEALARLRRDRPELWTARSRTDCRRGIEVYHPNLLPKVFRRACNDFHAAHGRFPDLVKPRTTADHWFALKFFHDIPLRPANPADKLASLGFMSAETRWQVGFPRRVWISGEPRLPGPDAAPPGVYWLKVSKGCSMQAKVQWPPSPEERAALQDKVAGWWANRYGRGWGEWWYSFGRQLLYLESDVSSQIAGRPEIKVFVRDGEPLLFYAIRLGRGDRHEQAYFDANLNRLEGHSPSNLPLEEDPPDTIGLMLKAAGEIGRRFRNCRIDFLNPTGPRPCFGEITICHNNARKILAPPSLDDMARRLLFE